VSARPASWLVLVALLGCVAPLAPQPPLAPPRVSQLGDDGDPARRASLRLCAEGLRADAAGLSVPARSRYERAMQIDATNPWAYLVLARHELEAGDASRALEYVQQAETLLRSEGAWAPGVEAHVAGLRGAARSSAGGDGSADLALAAQLAPEVWGDGRLDADELL